jgi:hypothetical protein
MRRQRRTSQFGGAALVRAILWACASLLAGTAWAAVQYTTQFPVDECTFSSSGRNLYFSLRPGDRLVLAGKEGGVDVAVQITVLNQTRSITFVTQEGESLTVITRVVEERHWENNELVEVSRNFFARCTQTGDIYYFGEDVDIYEDGAIVSHDGAWRAGKSGARPGIIMPGTFLLGARYFQELAPTAMDRAEHVKMGLTETTPAGTFRECVEIVETTPLEPGAQSIKRYCAELGLVFDSGAKLVEFHIAGFDD